MNHLAGQVSPYLKAHAAQPVDWYPWGAEAFDKAKREDKPVFLSVGYSTCHWCHVMSGESFEDAEVAQTLNKHFVAVKVDREERPDVDAVYIRVCQTLTGSAGWPMTVIMTPEQQPFFAASYIPKDDRNGQAGLLTLLRVLADEWKNRRETVLKTGADVTAYLRGLAIPAKDAPKKPLIPEAVSQLAASYDDEFGGFGKAPKFPSVPSLLFLLRYAHITGDRAARNPVEHTIRQIYRGGIYDHIGGGVCRYSTDREWLVPHFEKTLYDNALLAYLCAEAFRDGHLKLYRDIAEGTLDYCLRELRAPEGGFYSGQDADSGSEEGAYYLFTPAEIASVLGTDAGRHFAECYDITAEGNFRGKSIPNLLLNDKYNMLPEGYAGFREKLAKYRRENRPLARDTKLLTAWNGLMLMALSLAGRSFGITEYIDEARELAELLTPEGELCAVRAEGKSYGKAGLCDYAYLALGLLELYDADFDAEHLRLAARLAETITERFRCADGGFYDTPDDAEPLIVRPYEIFDGVMPSGNAAALMLFDKLRRLTAEKRWADETEALTEAIVSRAGRYPAGAAFSLCSVLCAEYPTRELVCVCPDERIPETLRAVASRYAPELSILVKTPANAGLLRELAPFTAALSAKDGKPSFCVCSGGQCSLPQIVE